MSRRRPGVSCAKRRILQAHRDDRVSYLEARRMERMARASVALSPASRASEDHLLATVLIAMAIIIGALLWVGDGRW